MKKYHIRFIMQNLLILFLILSMAIIILIITPPFRSKSVEVKIKSGSSLRDVAQELHNSHVIPSSRIFELYVRAIGSERSIKSGTYRFMPFESPIAAASKLIRGYYITQKVVIPEGRTARQIATILESNNVINAEAFLEAVNDTELAKSLGIPASSCEGYLFPDTYFFNPQCDSRELVSQMVAGFNDAIERIEGTKTKLLNPQSLHQRVILASIIEREYRLPEDAPLIASVFFNRLQRNMPLQSCATVVYVMTEHLGKEEPSVVHYGDLKIQDPYNTYINRGLPPGPISNPGEISLRAALFPPQTDYLYFRLDDVNTGKHRFSHTLEEHNYVEIIPKRQ